MAVLAVWAVCMCCMYVLYVWAVLAVCAVCMCCMYMYYVLYVCTCMYGLYVWAIIYFYKASSEGEEIVFVCFGVKSKRLAGFTAASPDVFRNTSNKYIHIDGCDGVG